MKFKGLLGGKYSNREDVPLEEEREVVKEQRLGLEDIQEEEVPGKSKRKRTLEDSQISSLLERHPARAAH